MKRNLRRSILIAVAVFMLLGTTFAQKPNAAGNWSGKIQLPTGQLEMIFKITQNEGGYEAKLDVPKQGAADLPVGDIVVVGDSITIAVPAIRGSYAGSFVSPDSITGKWMQSGMTFEVNMTRTGEIAPAKRPQLPLPPFPYLSEEVNYTNPSSGLKLAGTLTLPKDAKNCPAVVMITGSGAQDRDESLMGHKPFLVIADYLTRAGIAVLRVDDRGVGGSEGAVVSSTSLDFTGDVLAGIEFLKKRKEIAPEKIGLIGHSEGGLIAPMVASRSKDVAFIVMMAGPGVTGEEILYEQAALISRAAGLPEFSIEQGRLTQQKIFEVLKSETDSVKTVEKLRSSLSQGSYAGLQEEMKGSIDAEIAKVNNPWFRFFLTYDPAPTLKKVKCPVLALNGTKDLQVPVSNLDSVKKAVLSGGNKRITTLPLESLNHLFQTCETGSVSEYGQIEETIAPVALDTMKDWILKTVKK